MLTGVDANLLTLKAKLFNGFSDPSRLSILQALTDGPCSVGEIVTRTGLSQSNTSNHLNCLLGCGLVLREPRGRYAYYRLSDERIAMVLNLADGILADAAKGFYDCTRYDVGDDVAK